MNPDQIACLIFIRDNSPNDESMTASLPIAGMRRTIGFSLLKLGYVLYDLPTDVWTITAAGVTALGG